MNVLLVGGGGREHALAWKLRQSQLLDTFYCTPGNAGIRALAKLVPLNTSDSSSVARFCDEFDIGLVVIGPEAALVAGLADDLRSRGIAVFGPSRLAAQLEGSKSFTKAVCRERDIPTAAFECFSDADAALRYVRNLCTPVVVKADGLAAGKGVTVCETVAEAESAIGACFSGMFGESGSRVLIEEKLLGEEASFFAVCDGERALPLATAQDYKRAYDGDDGPNTGGMGAVSPAPLMTRDLEMRVMQEIITPTLDVMRERGSPFQGVLYAGLMLTAEGPKLIEYNVRFGDPECQVLLLRLRSDLLPVLMAAAQGDLSHCSLDWSDDAALTIVMAAKGYPGAYGTGSVIENLEDAERVEGVVVFHAGTVARSDGKLTAQGGRVLDVSAIGVDMAEARTRAYNAAGKIRWPEGFYRGDIGLRSVREKDNR